MKYKNQNIEIIPNLNPPTNPSTVTSETPLLNLNLNWSEKDLPEKLRTKHVHRLHPYLGKYIPQLIEIFLRKYFKTGQTILDPFCGSGTTLVQANELGINSIGYDISSFNVLLTRAKIKKYNIEKAKFEILDILNEVRQATQKTLNDQLLLWDIDNYSINMSLLDNQYLREWFAPEALKELLIYRSFIESKDYEYKDLLKIILSRAARSSRLVRHFDLDFPKRPQTTPYWCHKHFRECKPTQEAYKFIERYSYDIIKRIKDYSSLRTDTNVDVFHADSQEIKFPKVDGVITSPPYVGLIDYHDQHIYAYHLLGLKDNREKEIGSAKNGSSKKAIQNYQTALSKVFRNIANEMPSGGKMVIIAGDKYNLYDYIAEMAGLKIEATLKRHVNRRTGRRSNNFYECVFILSKH
jgi:DNA modification methylase